MTENEVLKEIIRHWYRYLSLGGINEPIDDEGKELSQRGLEHWASFLALGKAYVMMYNANVLNAFIPVGRVRLLKGE